MYIQIQNIYSKGESLYSFLIIEQKREGPNEINEMKGKSGSECDCRVCKQVFEFLYLCRITTVYDTLHVCMNMILISSCIMQSFNLY